MPPTRWIAGAVALALALSVAGCTGDDDSARDDRESTSTTEAAAAAVVLDVTRADLVSPHEARRPLDDATRDEVRDVVESLLLVTSATPLAEGKAGRGFAGLFTGDAGARAANADREAFFDEGLPRFGKLRAVEASVEMTGLAGSMDPATQLVVAGYTWTVESGVNPGDRVERTGTLSLVPDGDGWVIGAYTIVVTRTIDDSATTTTAEAG